MLIVHTVLIFYKLAWGGSFNAEIARGKRKGIYSKNKNHP